MRINASDTARHLVSGLSAVYLLLLCAILMNLMRSTINLIQWVKLHKTYLGLVHS